MYAKSQSLYSQCAGPRGLWNLGATCLLNATMQCTKGIKDIEKVGKKCAGPLCTSFVEALQMLDGEGEVANLQKFHETIIEHWSDYVPGTEMDAEEFLLFLLDSLHVETQSDIAPPLHNYPSEKLIGNVVAAWRSFNTSWVLNYCMRVLFWILLARISWDERNTSDVICIFKLIFCYFAGTCTLWSY